MKIAFLGNCQIANIGFLFRQMAQQKIINAEVLWNKPVFELTNSDYLPLLHSLDAADVIYVNYHDTYHGMYATNHLSKYFNFKIVPTLESFVSTPQMGNWSDESVPIPYNFNFIDYRILDMYMRKTDVRQAPDVYDHVKIKEDVIAALLRKSIDKYNERFEKKQVCFNYAPYYSDAMQSDIESYYTVHHPANRHLEWLVNSILADLGIVTRINLDNTMPQLLQQFWPPSLRNTTRKGRYIINGVATGLGTAIKQYYAYFDRLEAKYLESELHKSVYHSISA